MKESDYKKGLAEYLVKKDRHLALNIYQAEQLVEYIRSFEAAVGMLPPRRVPELTKYGEPNTIGEHTWEPEDD